MQTQSSCNYICTECGTQFSVTSAPPPSCPICEDERQFVNWQGQQWTTLDALRADHRNRIEGEASDLTGIGIEPSFAIGQRALLIQSPSGNVLWDCVTLIDDATIERVRQLGGLAAIAISHPHYYSSMIEWSRAFGDVPVYLHAADREWVMRSDNAIKFWEGATHQLDGGLTLICCGGHFAGGTVLHWAAGAGGRGALLTGDVIQVVKDRRYVSFMRSYPNYIPLSAKAVNQITAATEPFEFATIHGAWWQSTVAKEGKLAIARSAERYLRAIAGETQDEKNKALVQ